MEYISMGDLPRHIPVISSEDEVRQITIDLLEGVKIMHLEGFAHRDIKPQVCNSNPQNLLGRENAICGIPVC